MAEALIETELQNWEKLILREIVGGAKTVKIAKFLL